MESFSSYGEARADGGGQAAGRCRTLEEQESYRQAPPRGVLEQDPRRRSPASFSNRGRPGGPGCPPYLGPRQSPHNLPQPTASGGHAASTPGCHSPASQDGSSGAAAPVRRGQQHGQPQQSGNRSIMSLSNLVEQNGYQQDWMSD
ncbi:hypothetical protein CEP51_007574 [Fusarium floridanum]|uniref:Uncharacterized protein n=1 Tax=Fusarium floridanum TaxID=1325733 RepID=A0A428RNM7_9HYPO|nr:hypothetical protein CEP51_007574 [Fusarium floridanum]